MRGKVRYVLYCNTARNFYLNFCHWFMKNYQGRGSRGRSEGGPHSKVCPQCSVKWFH